MPGSKYNFQMFEELMRDYFNPPFEMLLTTSGFYFFHRDYSGSKVKNFQEFSCSTVQVNKNLGFMQCNCLHDIKH